MRLKTLKSDVVELGDIYLVLCFVNNADWYGNVRVSYVSHVGRKEGDYWQNDFYTNNDREGIHDVGRLCDGAEGILVKPDGKMYAGSGALKWLRRVAKIPVKGDLNIVGH